MFVHVVYSKKHLALHCQISGVYFSKGSLTGKTRVHSITCFCVLLTWHCWSLNQLFFRYQIPQNPMTVDTPYPLYREGVPIESQFKHCEDIITWSSRANRLHFAHLNLTAIKSSTQKRRKSIKIFKCTFNKANATISVKQIERRKLFYSNQRSLRIYYKRQLLRYVWRDSFSISNAVRAVVSILLYFDRTQSDKRGIN